MDIIVSSPSFLRFNAIGIVNPLLLIAVFFICTQPSFLGFFTAGFEIDYYYGISIFFEFCFSYSANGELKSSLIGLIVSIWRKHH
jgi:hypothetical protein